ncbi:ABC transporter substrate-binding protein [Tautonia sociabilis]|uniref:Amino acid ABC transporter substrate-binding protein n=1 Tax=Tautonia sociabilis TaxID=2080755 RepID=A0A432MQ80_9BACT|nr:hypothetical protein [Tautonia sociabilis]RUL89641.1 hypothetical protein TsocGM_00260 [Tautonia sociabilis]
MPLPRRAGTILLLIGGLALVGWMGFALTYGVGGTGDDRAPAGAVEVAVFLPEPGDWDDVREGVSACRRRGLIREVVERPDGISFRTERSGRRVRLSWVPGGGVVATRDRVTRLVGRPGGPAAVVGSNNTVLTAALAEALDQEVGRRGGRSASGGAGPVLLVPWATSVKVDRPGAASVPLLGLYPGRTFRFCPNNRQEAALVARVAADREGVPGGAVVVIDGNDPYSRDLAAGFEAAMAETAPEAKLVLRRLDLSGPGAIGPDDRPGPAELAEADRIWRFAEEVPGDGPVWAVLPLQGTPARRMIRALVDRSGPIGPRVLGRLQVLCGDGIGRTTLSELAGRCTLPVWCVSGSALPEDDAGAADELGGAQVLAEIVSAIALVLDRPGEEVPDLAAALAAIDLPADHPFAFGRSLAFDPSGERRAADLGHVLAILPGQEGVLAFGPVSPGEVGRLREAGEIEGTLAHR